MKKKVAVIIICILISLILPACGTDAQTARLQTGENEQIISSPPDAMQATQPTVVEFDNSVFEASIRLALDKPDGDIYQYELDNIYRLVIYWDDYAKINEAADEYIASEDYLYKGQIDSWQEPYVISLTDITMLPNLEELYITDLGINDAEALAGLSNLRLLCLTSDAINDISWIQSLTSLETVILKNNCLKIIPDINSLNNLVYLDLSSNGIEGSESILSLPNLEVFDLAANELTDVDFIRNLLNLQELWLSGNHELSNINGLVNLTNLTELHMDNIICLESLDSLSNLSNLRILGLEDTGVYDVTGFEGLSSLKELRMIVNEGVDMTPISKLGNLEYLYAMVHDKKKYSVLLPHLAGLTNLKTLYLDCNPMYYDYDASNVTDISYLKDLTNLELLHIYDGEVKDIEALRGMTELKSLIINDGQIADISPLAGLVNLELLELYSNEISDISVLANLHNLKILFIENNPIEDYSVLDQLDLDELIK